MQKPEDIEYTVVLVTPIFGSERENAQEVIEEGRWNTSTRTGTSPCFVSRPMSPPTWKWLPDVEEAAGQAGYR